MSCLRRARHLPLLRLRRGLSSSPASGALPPPRPSAGRRVVVTGLGAVTPLGRGVGATWDRLVAGRCAVRALAAEDLRLQGEAAGRTLEQLPSRVVAAVPRGKGEDEFDEEEWTKVWCLPLSFHIVNMCKQRSIVCRGCRPYYMLNWPLCGALCFATLGFKNSHFFSKIYTKYDLP